MQYNIDYTSRIINTLNRPYIEFWRVIENSGQTRFNGYEYVEQLQNCLKALVQLIEKRSIYIKYQVYRRTDGELLGFYDPQKVYRGITVGGAYYMQNDTINVLVLTKIGSDTMLQPQSIIPGQKQMLTKQINQSIPRYELW